MSIISDSINYYNIVHIHNGNNVFHLTRQILLDSALVHDTCCFFYRIIDDAKSNFDEEYGSFACIMPRSRIEADVYLNVDHSALTSIINYIQTQTISLDNNDTVRDHVRELASMFGMPLLVQKCRSYDNDEVNIQNEEQELD